MDTTDISVFTKQGVGADEDVLAFASLVLIVSGLIFYSAGSQRVDWLLIWHPY